MIIVSCFFRSHFWVATNNQGDCPHPAKVMQTMEPQVLQDHAEQSAESHTRQYYYAQVYSAILFRMLDYEQMAYRWHKTLNRHLQSTNIKY